MRTSLVFLSIFVLILAGCSGSGSGSVDMPTPIAVYTEAPAIQPAAQVTAKATVKATVASTATPLPSDTPTSEPSATPTDEPSATPTAALTATATIAAPVATPEAATDDSDIYAGLPAEILDLMPAADAANGQALSVSNGCIACHSLEKDVRVVGPSWYSVGTTAGERVAGESAGLYLYTSIVDPNAYINEGYISGLMPLTYKDVLSNEQMADVIAYLLSLQGE
jgi:mono/diheme cytochrome c family protein